MARFSANFSPPRRAAAARRAAAPLLPRERTTLGLVSLVYAVAGVASGVASGLASHVARPLATRVRSAPAGVLARARGLARRVEPFVDETVERVAVCFDNVLGLPGATTSYHFQQQMLLDDYTRFDLTVQQEQRAAAAAVGLAAAASASRSSAASQGPTLFQTMALSAFSSGHRAAAAAFVAPQVALNAAGFPRSWMINTLPAVEEEEGTKEEATTNNNNNYDNNYDPYALPSEDAEYLESKIANEVEEAVAAAAAAAAAAAEAKAAAERAAARNGNNKQLAAEAFLGRAVPVCLARVAAGLPPLPEKKELELEEWQLQQQVVQPEQPQPQRQRPVDDAAVETPTESGLFETDEDSNDVVEREEQQGAYDDSDAEAEAMEVEVDEEEEEELNTLPSPSSSSSPPPPPSARTSVFDPTRMSPADVPSAAIVGSSVQRKNNNNNAFFTKVVAEMRSKINGGGGSDGEDSSTRCVLSSRSGSDASLSSASSLSASSSNGAATSSRPPLPPAHIRAVDSLRASASSVGGLEAIAVAGRSALSDRLHLERARWQLREQSDAAGFDAVQQWEQQCQLEAREHVESALHTLSAWKANALAAFEQERRERE